MHGRIARVVAGALIATALLSPAGSAGAAEIATRYQIDEVMSYRPTITSQGANIDDTGYIGIFSKPIAGEYEIDWIWPYPRSKTDDNPYEIVVRKSGSDNNLLSEPLKFYGYNRLSGFNASGGVVGSYYDAKRAPYQHIPYYYNVETKEHIDLQRLPGFESPGYVTTIYFYCLGRLKSPNR